MKTAVLGATGYTGLILLRLLTEHPEVTQIIAVSSSHTGEDVRAADPGLPPSIAEKLTGTAGTFVSIDQAVSLSQSGGIDAVFAGLPHLKSAEICSRFMGRSVLIDLSADFRFKDPAVFATTYGAEHPRPELLANAVYGLAEWHRKQIKKTDLIAQPGCYPTAVLLPLLPLAREGLLKGTVIANAISGISGAGKKERIDLLYCERTENAGAYNPGTSHRHAPEIWQELASASPSLELLFTPHLAPLKRGMTVTTVAELTRDIPESGKEGIEGIFAKYYGNEPFISLAGARIPQSRDVWGSNRCDIGWRLEKGRIMLFSALDNLIKGASGNAVQCMNIRFGLDERAGLRSCGEL